MNLGSIDLVTILSSITDAFFSLNADWQFTYLNPPAEQIWGKDSQALLGKSIWTEFPSLEPNFYHACLQAKQENRTFTVETNLNNVRLEIRLYPFAAGLTVCCRHLAPTAIEPAAPAEPCYCSTTAELKQLQQKITGLTQQPSIGVIEWNLDFVATAWNPAAEAIFGYSHQEAIGCHAAGLILPEAIKPLIDQLWNQLITGQGGTRNTNENLTKAGKIITCEWFNTPLLNQDQQVVGVLSVVIDISELKKTQERLQTSQQFLDAILNNIADPVFVKNAKHQFVLANQAFCQLIQAEQANLLGRSNYDLFSQAKADQVSLKDEQVLMSGSESLIEEEVMDATGHCRYLSTKKTQFQNQQGDRFLVGIIRDLTERKQVEEEIRHQQHLFKGILDNIPHRVWFKDCDGRHIAVNAAFCQANGRSVENIVGKTDFELWPASVAEVFLAEDQQVIQSGMPMMLEKEIPTQSGVCWFTNIKTPMYNPAGQIIGTTGVSMNITERKQAELAVQQSKQELERRVEERTAALAESEARFRTIAATIPGAIFQFSVRQDVWTIDYMSDRVWDIVGVTALEMMVDMQTLIDRQHPEDRAQYVKSIETSLQTLTPWHYEGRLSKPNGEIHWWQGDALPAKDIAGNIILCGVMVDITSRKQAELALRQSESELRRQKKELETTLVELRQTQAQLVQSEKMSSLGQLVAGVAHEINNPVNFIYGNLNHAHGYMQDLLSLLQLYQEQYPNPESLIQHQIEAIDLGFLIEDLPKLMTSMKVGADRIQKIVASLRTFSRMDEAEMKTVDIHEGIESTLMILQNRLKAKSERMPIEVHKFYGELPLIDCYAGQLNQVFMNILSNAIDALEEKAERLQEQEQFSFIPQIEIRTELQNSGQVIIAIADNALGISESVQHRLFDPFFTTKPVGKGTGMGLSISYQIITEKHGGRLLCNSSSAGTEFLIQIPAVQQWSDPIQPIPTD